MGKASSAKKIKRVQQAGVSRAPGQRRNLGYPAMIIAIIVVGSALVVLARGQSSAAADEAPVANQDHWHAAFALNICGQFQANPGDSGPDTKGIHTHQDGLIHIHPFGSAASGERATFGVFAEQTGIEVSNGEMTLPDGTVYKDGDDCEDEDGKKEPGQVVMYVWPPQATDATEPELVTTDIDDIRFTEDGQILVLAFVPEGTEIPLPPSVEALANPIDLETPPEEGTTEFTTTTVAGAEGSDSTEPAGAPSTTEATPTTEPGNG